MAFEWITQLFNLSPAALTVRAQALSPNDEGRLLWDIFFPRQNVDSVDLADVLTLDTRAAADRREWNGNGRLIPVETPSLREISMVPIEAYDKIDEKEMQRLMERFLGNAQLIANQIGVSLPDRGDRLAQACYRRLELDAFSAWLTGTIVQRNPQDAAKTYTASFGIDSGRIQTAATAWNDPGLNAYDEFLAWAEDGMDEVGPMAGAMLRLPTLKAIQADAPDLANGVQMTRADLESRIQDDLGSPFRFFINEQTIDVFNDGGTAKTRTKVFAAEKVAFIPQGNAVGYSGFAPVVRAMELSSQVPDAGIDIRGATVYHNAHNAGKELEIQAQLNALPVPDEELIWVIDAGV
jgi:hypothetical protein